MISSIRSKQRLVEEKRKWKSEHSRDRSSHLRHDDKSERTLDDRLSDLPIPAILEKSVLASIDTIKLYKTTLSPLVCSYGMVREETCGNLRLRSMAKRECQHLGTEATIIFAVRRAGCASCRINAQTLVDVARQDRVALVGVVKETSDITALSDFHSQYFGQFPIYKDNRWGVFDSLGNRRISTWKMIRKNAKLGRSYREKGIHNVSFGGDARTLGGVLLFDRCGNLRYTIFERYGEEVCMEELRSAIASLNAEHSGPTVNYNRKGNR